MVQHLEANEIINPNQHGCRQNRLPVSSLLIYCENIIDFNAIYLDFSKVFNKVEHNILLLKIKILYIKFLP